MIQHNRTNRREFIIRMAAGLAGAVPATRLLASTCPESTKHVDIFLEFGERYMHTIQEFIELDHRLMRTIQEFIELDHSLIECVETAVTEKITEDLAEVRKQIEVFPAPEMNGRDVSFTVINEL